MDLVEQGQACSLVRLRSDAEAVRGHLQVRTVTVLFASGLDGTSLGLGINAVPSTAYESEQVGLHL
ncbi:MAG: hypothetical protein MIO92_10585 [Methanosarcinaceae archaeon]|nr:hypothetical protein [Methanosarcinaceae archaeon]